MHSNTNFYMAYVHAFSILIIALLIPRYIGRTSKLEEIDQKLLQIQLPNTVNRNPRSITQRKFWKGEQFTCNNIHVC